MTTEQNKEEITHSQNIEKLLCDWLKKNDGEYIGDYDKDDLDSVCLDGWFDLEMLASDIKQHISSELKSISEEIENKLGENRRTPPKKGQANNTESYRKIVAHYKGYNKGVADILSLLAKHIK